MQEYLLIIVDTLKLVQLIWKQVCPL